MMKPTLSDYHTNTVCSAPGMSCRFPFRRSLIPSIIVILTFLFSFPGILFAEGGDGGTPSGSAVSGPVLEIFHPLDGSIFSSELTHLVARVSGNAAPYAVIRVNEQITPVIDLSDESYRDVLGETLIVRLYLLQGENEVEITLKDEEAKIVESRKIMLYYRDRFGNETSTIPPRYAIRPMHTPGSGEYCEACHRMKVDPVIDMEPEKKYDLPCVKCHEAGMLSGRPHGTATWRCLACHESGGDPSYGVKDDDGIFCQVDCHSEEVEIFKGMSSVHSDVRAVTCRSCHRMHNAQEDGLIPTSVNKLCFDCHRNVYSGGHIAPGHPLEARKDPSREGREFDCTSCHDPHASNFKKLMRFKKGMSMCAECHKM